MPISLRSARINKGLTQEELARLLGISTCTLSRFEQDPDRVSINMARRIADILGWSVADIFFHEESTIRCEENVER